jgi:hypothetical protein
MRHTRKFTGVRLAAFAGAGAIALAAAAFAAEYQMTVNRDRLVNAQNEPQNWLLMNGDYASTRYSKLTQINRDNVRNLRLVWALALGGMQDVGQNGPESMVNPLIDHGMMYTTDGWGTVYKIDARNQNKGEFVWIADPGVKHEGNAPRTRGIALWEDLVIANLPDGRVIAVERDPRDFVLVQAVEFRVVFCLAGFYQTVIDGLGVGQTARRHNEPLTGLRQREYPSGLSFTDCDGFFRQQPLLLQAADFTFHAACVALVSETSKVTGGDHAKSADFRECLELRIAYEVGSIPQVMSLRGIRCFRLAFVTRGSVLDALCSWLSRIG